MTPADQLEGVIFRSAPDLLLSSMDVHFNAERALVKSFTYGPCSRQARSKRLVAYAPIPGQAPRSQVVCAHQAAL
jgi:hypothetical protein